MRGARGLDRTARRTELRIRELGLRANAGALDAALVATVQRAAMTHGLELLSVRAGANESPVHAVATTFRERQYEVVVRGAYPAEVRAFADLSTAPLVIRTDRMTFERVRRGGAATGEVVATFGLSTLRFEEDHVRADGP